MTSSTNEGNLFLATVSKAQFLIFLAQQLARKNSTIIMPRFFCYWSYLPSHIALWCKVQNPHKDHVQNDHHDHHQDYNQGHNCLPVLWHFPDDQTDYRGRQAPPVPTGTEDIMKLLTSFTRTGKKYVILMPCVKYKSSWKYTLGYGYKIQSLHLFTELIHLCEVPGKSYIFNQLNSSNIDFT